jgi:hypothetical protein
MYFLKPILEALVARLRSTTLSSGQEFLINDPTTDPPIDNRTHWDRLRGTLSYELSLSPQCWGRCSAAHPTLIMPT